MKTITLVLGYLAVFAALLGMLAILPLFPGYLAEGATAPTDVDEVAAASDRLKVAGLGLLLTAGVIERAAMPPSALARYLFACVAVAHTLYRAWEVVPIVIVWAGHVRGENAGTYWAFLITMPILALLATFVVYQNSVMV